MYAQYFQIDFHKGDKEEKHWRVFMRAIYHGPIELLPLHLVWLASCKLQVGKLSCGHH